jgi:hypothetical protein
MLTQPNGRQNMCRKVCAFPGIFSFLDSSAICGFLREKAKLMTELSFAIVKWS